MEEFPVSKPAAINEAWKIFKIKSKELTNELADIGTKRIITNLIIQCGNEDDTKSNGEFHCFDANNKMITPSTFKENEHDLSTIYFSNGGNETTKFQRQCNVLIATETCTFTRIHIGYDNNSTYTIHDLQSLNQWTPIIKKHRWIICIG